MAINELQSIVEFQSNEIVKLKRAIRFLFSIIAESEIHSPLVWEKYLEISEEVSKW